MDLSQNRIDDLVASPSESLNVELKRWIDPATPEGQAKIVKACFALRNRNGGFLAIGFDNRTLLPDVENVPSDPRRVFHFDDIQRLISHHANELFEVEVMFSSRDGIEHPVISVPSGVQVPVVVKRPIIKEGGKHLISERDVFFRTLNANEGPSSALAQPKDWREILDICFENREADIGRFLRRQLGGLDGELLGEIMKTFGLNGEPASISPPSLKASTAETLKVGRPRLIRAVERRTDATDIHPFMSGLLLEVGVDAYPPLPTRSLDKSLLTDFLGSVPRYQFWSTWLDTRSFPSENDRPTRIELGWETLYAATGDPKHFSYWFTEGTRFYALQALPDDLSGRVAPKSALDPMVSVFQVTDAISGALSFAKTLAAADDTAVDRSLGFVFNWTNLRGRALKSWAVPVSIMGFHKTQANTAEGYVEVPLDTPLGAIAPFVGQAIQPLMHSFNGESIPLHVLELWTQRFVNRQLNI